MSTHCANGSLVNEGGTLSDDCTMESHGQSECVPELGYARVMFIG